MELQGEHIWQLLISPLSPLASHTCNVSMLSLSEPCFFVAINDGHSRSAPYCRRAGRCGSTRAACCT